MSVYGKIWCPMKPKEFYEAVNVHFHAYGPDNQNAIVMGASQFIEYGGPTIMLKPGSKLEIFR
jgi:hypothetical protein